MVSSSLSHVVSLNCLSVSASHITATTVRAYREGAVPGRYEVLERSTTHPSVPIMGSSKDTGVKRKYIRAYQFGYSRIDEAEGDPTSHTSRGIIATNLRGEVPENLVVRFGFATSCLSLHLIETCKWDSCVVLPTRNAHDGLG